MEIEKMDDGSFHVEMTRRNLTALLNKLDDPLSARTLCKVGKTGEFFTIQAVEDEEHYSNRSPGEVYMPSSGEWY